MKKNILLINNVEKKKEMENINNDVLKGLNNVSTVNKIFLNEEFDNKHLIKSNLMKKRSSYRTQDINKNRLKENFITYDEIVEKLVISKLKCSYCKDSVLILYENKRDNKQWTLDRVDNNLGHSSFNTVISCLKCNLQKRKRDDDKFRFTKQMNLIKIY